MLEPQVVRIAINLHPQGWPTAQTDQELASLLGTREELLAYLLSRTNFLERHSDVLAAIRNLAETHGRQMETNRPKVEAPANARHIGTQIREVVVSVVNGETAINAAKPPFDALERQNALYVPDPSPFVEAPERWFTS
jgi:hypothetical protein